MTTPLDDAAFVEAMAAIPTHDLAGGPDLVEIRASDRDRLVALARSWPEACCQAGYSDLLTADGLRTVLTDLQSNARRQIAEQQRLGTIIQEQSEHLDSARQRLADAEAQRDLAKRLVARLPLCQDHRDKFDPEHCQACRAERAEARGRELEEAARHTVDEAYCEASEDDPDRILCPVDSLPELRATLARRTT